MNRYKLKSKVLWISKDICIGRVMIKKKEIPPWYGDNRTAFNKDTKSWPKIMTIKGIDPSGMVIVQSITKKSTQCLNLDDLRDYYE